MNEIQKITLKFLACREILKYKFDSIYLENVSIIRSAFRIIDRPRFTIYITKTI
jgi:hypothetical protein